MLYRFEYVGGAIPFVLCSCPSSVLHEASIIKPEKSFLTTESKRVDSQMHSKQNAIPS